MLKKYIKLITILFVLTNCAIPARTHKMFVNDLPVKKNLGDKIYVEESTGGSITLPFWVPKIPNDNFTDAIKKSIIESQAFYKITNDLNENWNLKIKGTSKNPLQI